MANRRSLGEAMTLSPETKAFIQGAKVSPAEPVVAKNLAVVEPEPDSIPPQVAVEEPTPSEPVRTPVRSQTRRIRERAGRETASIPISGFGQSQLMAPLTTRLQPATAAALKRAGLEQRLRGQEPATVQEIVEIAVHDWLTDHGYL